MIRVLGSGGALYVAARPFAATVSLEDCGDGFVWRARDSSLRYWLDAPEPEFDFYEFQRWESKAPLRIDHLAGQVEFSRCLRGLSVRARCLCRPLTLVSTSKNWRVEARLVVDDVSVLGNEARTTAQKPRDHTVTFVECFPPLSVEPDEDLLFELTWGTTVLTGIGTPADRGADVIVSFDPEGVCHVSA